MILENSIMFRNIPKIYTHTAAIKNGNLVTPEFIINKTEGGAQLLNRHCPHRMYPLGELGQSNGNIVCKFHGLQWSESGQPINSDKKLHCGKATVGRSGLIFTQFQEPDAEWVSDLAKETELEYSHSYYGKSNGSWLWFMDVNTDLLHVYKEGIHPFLSKQVNLEDIKMSEGDGWILQEHPDGWWCCIYPFTFVEYGRHGMLSINTVIPNNLKSEFGFQWVTQIFYAPDVDVNAKMIFETLEPVFHEDVAAAELQKGPYFPLREAMNRYEDHCIHWGKWYNKFKI
jgi:nitrite reductase/ring-hydroxylating ferredoxin subunit